MDTTTVKPGWKTTEFWGKIAVQVMTLWGAVKGFVPANTALIVTTALEAIYTIGRTIVKAVSDIQAAKATSTGGDTATANVTVKAS